MSKTKEKQPFFTATRMAAIAIFAATGGILYSVQIPMPVMFAPWLKFNPSDIPILIGSFALGAPSGAIIAVLRTLIGLLFKPTTAWRSPCRRGFSTRRKKRKAARESLVCWEGFALWRWRFLRIGLC